MSTNEITFEIFSNIDFVQYDDQRLWAYLPLDHVDSSAARCIGKALKRDGLFAAMKEAYLIALTVAVVKCGDFTTIAYDGAAFFDTDGITTSDAMR